MNYKFLFAFPLIFFAYLSLLAQNGQVTGKVVANDGDSVLAGVTVKVKGTSTFTSTANDGTFAIHAAPNSVLVFSSIGFTTMEVPVKNLSKINIRLFTDPQSLQQVVVIGYGTVKRKDLTGAISSVNSSTIEKVPVVSAAQALQGRAAGVQVTNNDGAPGGNITVLIRGTGSLASYGNDPLYVIDGYPVGTNVNNINPNDIATIDVLKDASATAIYGIRAANGVVIITTKKGKKGTVQVSVDAYEAFQGKPKEYKLLNAQQFATMSNQVEASDSTHTYHGLGIWHTPDLLHSVDWQNALYRSGLTQSYNVGIRGGNDKLQSAMSAGFYNQKGIVLGSYFKRLSISLNLDYQPTKWL
ncbi:MAG TPA: TonB-dependent receptor plug domain-containing protein, partial [Puia sp.]|nr:TonB-dependent receptor plug domain-containing protein [Puia sp.]